MCYTHMICYTVEYLRLLVYAKVLHRYTHTDTHNTHARTTSTRIYIYTHLYCVYLLK